MNRALNRAYITFSCLILIVFASQAISWGGVGAPALVPTPPFFLLHERDNTASEYNHVERLYRETIRAAIAARTSAYNKPQTLINPTTAQTTPSSTTATPDTNKSENHAQLLKELQQLRDQVASLSEELEQNREQIAISNIPRGSTVQPQTQIYSSQSKRINTPPDSRPRTSSDVSHSARYQAEPAYTHPSGESYPASGYSYNTPQPLPSSNYEPSTSARNYDTTSTQALEQEKKKLKSKVSRLKQQNAEAKQRDPAAGDRPHLPALLPPIEQQYSDINSKTKSNSHTSSASSRTQQRESIAVAGSRWGESSNVTSSSLIKAPRSPSDVESSELSITGPASLALLLLENTRATDDEDENAEQMIKQIMGIENKAAINWLQPLLLPDDTSTSPLTPNGNPLKIEDSVPFALMLRHVHHLPEKVVEYIIKRMLEQPFDGWIQGYKTGPVASSGNEKAFIWYSPLGDTLTLIHRNEDNLEALSSRIALAFAIIGIQAEMIVHNDSKNHRKPKKNPLKDIIVPSARTSVDATSDQRKLLDIDSTFIFLLNTLETYIHGMDDRQLVRIGNSIDYLQEITGLLLDTSELVNDSIAAARVNQGSRQEFEDSTKDRIRKFVESTNATREAGRHPSLPSGAIPPPPAPPPPAIAAPSVILDKSKLKKRRDILGLKIQPENPLHDAELKKTILNKKPLTEDELKKIEIKQEERRRKAKESYGTELQKGERTTKAIYQ